MDIGMPKAAQPSQVSEEEEGEENELEEYLHLLRERLSHQPSFECFGGHFEFASPLPDFWEIHWETLGDA